MLGGMIGAGLGAVGGLLGADEARSGATAAGNAQKAAISAMIAKLDAIGMPPDQSAAIILEQYKQAGIYNPQLEQQVADSVTEFSKLKSDPALRDTQIQALQQMKQYGKAGLTPDERAAMRLAQSEVQRQNQANQESIIQNLAMRGQGGGGAEIAARLGGAQAAADRSSEEADRVSALAAQRALQAISASSGMAGQLRGQDYSEDAQRASAMDEMNRFNVQNQMGINQRNVASSNVAQAANLENLQRIKDANVSNANEEKYKQLERQRQYWTDKLNYAKSYADPLRAYGDAAAQQALGESKARQSGISAGFGGLAAIASGIDGGGGSGKGPSVDKDDDLYGKKTDATGKGYGYFG